MDSELIYITGNGLLTAVFNNGDMVQLIGPPCSAPSVFKSEFIPGAEESKHEHVPFAGIWTTKLYRNNKEFARTTELTPYGYSCHIRRIIPCGDPLTIRVSPCDEALIEYALQEEWQGNPGYFIKTKNGNPVYNDIPLPFPQYYRIFVKGEGEVIPGEGSSFDVLVKGETYIYFVGGPAYGQCQDTAEAVAKAEYDQLWEETVARWREVFKEVTILEKLPNGNSRWDRLIKAIEDTVINVISQQSAEGGVLAGPPFPLGYVRDQYGICMAMLRMGMYSRARKMLDFYIDVFRQNGKIMNAQGLGVKGLFHFGENDKTEITGYLLLQFFKYSQITGDDSILKENVDFLQWLYDCQESQLHKGMLPFNGDETYIAGLLLPRDVINEGSAEATMLYILSGRLLVDFLRKEQGDEEKISRMEGKISSSLLAYKDNFIINGRYTLNNPRRLEGLEQPKYRHGVCLNGGVGDCLFFGDTQLWEGGVYLCPKCINQKRIPKRKQQLYYLPSALLMPEYLDSDLIDKEILRDYTRELAQKVNKDGYFYSDEATEKNVGYDYGLLLYNMVKLDVDGAEAVFEKILDIMDEVGTWSERYIGSKPSGVRYRPWESSINIHGMIEYALKMVK